MQYTCPMHPEIIRDRPGKCPKCGGMDLVPMENNKSKNSFFSVYRPLIIIFCLLLFLTLVLTVRDIKIERFDLERSMSYFMAGFFLIFAGFKLLDLKGFKTGYATYDILAKKFPYYGFVYPFIELFFGMGYLLRIESLWFHFAVLIVMTFSGIGVLQKLLKREKFQCVCLGTLIKVPLTKVTFIEDFGMAAMALIMIVL